MDLNDNWWANNNPNFSNLINGQISIKNYAAVKLNMDSEAKVNTPVSINLIWNNAVFKRNAIFKSTGGDISGNVTCLGFNDRTVSYTHLTLPTIA